MNTSSPTVTGADEPSRMLWESCFLGPNWFRPRQGRVPAWPWIEEDGRVERVFPLRCSALGGAASLSVGTAATSPFGGARRQRRTAHPKRTSCLQRRVVERYGLGGRGALEFSQQHVLKVGLAAMARVCQIIMSAGSGPAAGSALHPDWSGHFGSRLDLLFGPPARPFPSPVGWEWLRGDKQIRS